MSVPFSSKMGGKAVAQGVDGDPLVEVRDGASGAAGSMQHGGMDWMLAMST